MVRSEQLQVFLPSLFPTSRQVDAHGRLNCTQKFFAGGLVHAQIINQPLACQGAIRDWAGRFPCSLTSSGLIPATSPDLMLTYSGLQPCWVLPFRFLPFPPHPRVVALQSSAAKDNSRETDNIMTDPYSYPYHGTLCFPYRPTVIPL